MRALLIALLAVFALALSAGELVQTKLGYNSSMRATNTAVFDLKSSDFNATTTAKVLNLPSNTVITDARLIGSSDLNSSHTVNVYIDGNTSKVVFTNLGVASSTYNANRAANASNVGIKVNDMTGVTSFKVILDYVQLDKYTGVTTKK